MTAPVPRRWTNTEEHLAKLSDSVNQILSGKTNNYGTFTATALTTTTAISDRRIGINSFIGFMPTTANAALELSTMYVSSRGNGTATVTHANGASSDRTFIYCVIG